MKLQKVKTPVRTDDIHEHCIIIAGVIWAHIVDFHRPDHIM